MTRRGLYAITPEGLAPEILVARAEHALQGGVRLLQYRSKDSDPQRQLEVARALRALCRRLGAAFIINDDVDLALAVDADGAHLGREDGDLTAARARLGRRLLGASCYDRLDLARAAVAAGADYVAFGSVYASPTKPAAVRAPLSLFGQARALGVPLCAIGGITLENAPTLIRAGADLLAVVSDLFDANDVAARARAYAQLFDPESVTLP
ncbi:MAG: thiamine-phosphate synthase [Betaproteobacteria bacterium SG8_39]|nr:MAG: thiamine-phosphate synthase [Betaproteobacteria bacterium SG8_39]